MGLKTLITRWKPMHHNQQASPFGVRPASLIQPVHADDVITAWGANPSTGLRDYQPPSIPTLKSSSNTQRGIRAKDKWTLVAVSPSTATSHNSTNSPQPRITSNLETFLFFTTYIMLRALPAIRTLKSNSANGFEQMIAGGDIAFAGLYLFFLGQVMGAICQGILSIAGLASWVGNPVVLGGIGMVLWFIKEEEKD